MGCNKIMYSCFYGLAISLVKVNHALCVEDIEELFRFGHIASPEERQLIADEKAGKIVSQQQRIAANRPYL